jgi:hypothetical protein
MALPFLLRRQSSGSGLVESREYGRGTRCADHVIPSNPQMLALTSPTSGGGSVSVVRSRTKAMEFSLVTKVNLAPYTRTPCSYMTDTVDLELSKRRWNTN